MFIMIIMIMTIITSKMIIKSYRWQAGKIGLAASGFNNTIQQYRYLCASLRRRGGVEQLRSGKRGECGGTRRHWQGAALSGRSLSTKALETTHDEFKIISSSHIISYHIDLWVSNLGSQQNTWEITIILVIMILSVIIVIIIILGDLVNMFTTSTASRFTIILLMLVSIWIYIQKLHGGCVMCDNQQSTEITRRLYYVWQPTKHLPSVFVCFLTMLIKLR